MSTPTSSLASASPKRRFLPSDFLVDSWEGLLPYFDQLLEANPEGEEAFMSWLAQVEELLAVIQEESAWRYIRMSCDTQDELIKAQYQHFVQDVAPHISLVEHRLNEKIVAHPAFSKLPVEYAPFVRSLHKQMELFVAENIPLATEVTTLGQQYGTLMSKMTIQHDGRELTMQQASKLLEGDDREARQAVWEKIHARRHEDQPEIESLFDQMMVLRRKIAQQAGYDSYTQYRFDERGRFDYTVADTEAFHLAVEKVVRPVAQALYQERKDLLGLDTLRPWDLQVDLFGSSPLRPFETPEALYEGVVRILHRVHPSMSEMIQIMKKGGFLDLESRKGKMPGGYNYPLMETGIPFIFMNATGTNTDVITLLHESGHAVHAFLTQSLPLFQRSVSSEVAELAAMGMELLCLDMYDEFYSDKEELVRAQKNQLSRCITALGWIATVDAFQLWVYGHPGHTQAERAEAFRQLYFRFHGHHIDWTGYEDYLSEQWLRQLHIFDYPFYYIEYGFAQLGALSLWRNYRQDPQACVTQYLHALALGGTKSIPEVYEAAGIRFDFSEEYVGQSVKDCLHAYQTW